MELCPTLCFPRNRPGFCYTFLFCFVFHAQGLLLKYISGSFAKITQSDNHGRYEDTAIAEAYSQESAVIIQVTARLMRLEAQQPIKATPIEYFLFRLTYQMRG